MKCPKIRNLSCLFHFLALLRPEGKYSPSMRACYMQINFKLVFVWQVNTGNLSCWLHILGQKYILESLHGPSWPAWIWAHMCCAWNALLKGRSFILILELKSVTSFIYEKTSLVKIHVDPSDHRLSRYHGPISERNLVSVLRQRSFVYIRFLQTELYGTFNSVVHTPHSSC